MKAIINAASRRNIFIYSWSINRRYRSQRREKSRVRQRFVSAGEKGGDHMGNYLLLRHHQRPWVNTGVLTTRDFSQLIGWCSDWATVGRVTQRCIVTVRDAAILPVTQLTQWHDIQFKAHILHKLFAVQHNLLPSHFQWPCAHCNLVEDGSSFTPYAWRAPARSWFIGTNVEYFLKKMN